MQCLSIFALLIFYAFAVSTENCTIQGYNESTELRGYQRIGDKYYLINHSDKVNWVQAWSKCRQQNATLASFDNVAEMQALSETIIGMNLPQDPWFWVSGRDLAESNNYVWFTNGQGVDKNLFSTGQPDFPGVESCLHIWNRDGKFALNNWRCEMTAYYVCQIQPRTIQITIL